LVVDQWLESSRRAPIKGTTMHVDFASHFRSQAAAYGDGRSCTYLRESGRTLVAETTTYRQLDEDARALAAWLATRPEAQRPVLLLYLDGIDFLRAFLGCLYAGVTAVPAPLPHDERSTRRVAGMITDVRAELALTTGALMAPVGGYLAANGIGGVEVAATDGVPLGDPGQWAPLGIDGGTAAFLQYTSGSTSEPKGVIVTHRNLMANEAAIAAAAGGTDAETTAGWLPHFHDMGLVGMLLSPLYAGGNLVFMSPLAFLKRPVRWLQMIHQHRAALTVAPNFAYDLVARRITDEQVAALDLSCLRFALNGAEPVRAQTLDAFTAKLRPAGFRAEAIVGAYGMAEATLMATATRPGVQPARIAADPAALEQGFIVPAETSARHLVSSGYPVGGLDIRIVDPQTRRPLPDNRVGEIWINGASVAAGYWNRPDETAATFGARLRSADPADQGEYLRTGDLGVRRDGQFHITGRLKDLLVINGRNLYPQDIEEAVREVHPAVAESPGVVLAVDHAGRERLVVVQAVKPERMAGAALPELSARIKTHVARGFDVPVPSVVLVGRHGVHRTTSGKVQRSSMRESFLRNRIDALLHEDIEPALRELRAA
jgi:acyl-CoA synthetase (AMP-forming)/AMP-acid ligase II